MSRYITDETIDSEEENIVNFEESKFNRMIPPNQLSNLPYQDIDPLAFDTNFQYDSIKIDLKTRNSIMFDRNLLLKLCKLIKHRRGHYPDEHMVIVNSAIFTPLRGQYCSLYFQAANEPNPPNFEKIGSFLGYPNKERLILNSPFVDSFTHPGYLSKFL